MAKVQTLVRTARGLFTNFNGINAIPEGGLEEAVNVDIDRPGVISKVRGRNYYGDQFGGANIASSLFEYLGRLHYGQITGGSFEYDSDGAGTWASLSSINTPTSTLETRLRMAEILGNAYIASDWGLIRRHSLSTGWSVAGIYPVWDVIASFTGTGAGFMDVDASVAYRVIRWRKIGDREYFSAPSRRVLVSNPKYTGLAFTNVTGTITVTHTAHGYSNGNIIEILDSSDEAQVANGPKTITYINANSYSFTATGAGSGGTLSDGKKFNVDLYCYYGNTGWMAGDKIKVYRTEFSASASTDPGDEEYFALESLLTTGWNSHTVSDTVEEAFLDDPLYTNSSLQGIHNANDRPPWCHDVALWKGHLWMLNIKWPHRLEIQLDSISGLTDDTSSITIKDVGLADEATFTFSTAENLGTNKFQRFTTEATQALNVKRTCESFCKVFNDDLVGALRARYVSEPDDHPGKLVIESYATTIGSGQFSGKIQIKVNNSTTGGKFTPALPTTYDGTVESTEDPQIHGLAHSKFDMPDAVPRDNWDPIGGQNKKGIRILALRDSLIIVKEDGIYRASGETDGLAGDEFSITQLDPSIQAICPHSWVVLNNSVMGLSTQGVVKVNETGTDIMSAQVEDLIKQITQVADYQLYTHAVAYESDRKYLLYYRSSSANPYADKCLVYNYLTETWAIRSRNVSCAHVLTTDDKLYEATPEYYVVKERKDYAVTDQRDESYSTTVTSHSTTTWEGNTVSTVQTPASAAFEAVGNLFEHNAQEANVVAYNAGVVTLDKLLTITDAQACIWSKGISSRVRWRPEACQNVGLMKQFIRLQLYFEAIQALRHKIAIYSDENLVEAFLADIVQSATLGRQLLSIMVPRKMQRCRALQLVYEHNRAKEDFDILNVAFTFRTYGDLTSRDPR